MVKAYFTSSWLKDIVGLSVLLVLFYSVCLNHYPLHVPDEARYSEIPREMLATGDYISPHLNGLLYFEKPVLFYWLQAGAIKLFGMHEWSLRFVTALMAILGCLFTYIATRILYNRTCAWMAASILATSLLYFAMGHLITLDMTLTAWLTGCLLSYRLAIHYPVGNRRRVWMWLAYSFAALATLTKGLVGILFPGVIIGLWVALTRQWRLLKEMHWLTGLTFFCVIALPWHIIIQLQHPAFAHFYLWEQQFLRFLTKAAGRYQPAWFFIPIALIGFFPWVTFLLATLQFHFKQRYDSRSLFWLLWAGVIFVFFSLSNSKLIPYILPIFPPLAIMVAQYLNQQMAAPYPKGLRISFYALPLCAFILAIAFIEIPYFNSTASPPVAKFMLRVLGIVLIVGSLLTVGLLKRIGLRSSFISMLAMAVLAWWLLLYAIPSLDDRSIKPLAILLKPRLKANDWVVTYENYYQDLPVYLERIVAIVGWINELGFGSRQQDTSDILLSRDKFWRLWLSQQQIYMITDKSTFMHLLKIKALSKYTLLGQANNRVLLSN